MEDNKKEYEEYKKFKEEIKSKRAVRFDNFKALTKEVEDVLHAFKPKEETILIT